MERKQLFRLCHACNCLNESEEEILKCQNCGKGFLPINYFDKIRMRAQLAEQGDRGALPDLSLNPIHGLIVFW